MDHFSVTTSLFLTHHQIHCLSCQQLKELQLGEKEINKSAR